MLKIIPIALNFIKSRTYIICARWYVYDVQWVSLEFPPVSFHYPDIKAAALKSYLCSFYISGYVYNIPNWGNPKKHTVIYYST